MNTSGGDQRHSAGWSGGQPRDSPRTSPRADRLLPPGFDRIVRSAGVDPLALAASVRLITTTLQEI